MRMENLHREPISGGCPEILALLMMLPADGMVPMLHSTPNRYGT
jgi:hypothetical protein